MSPRQSASAPKNRKSTRQLLEKIPNFPCLYRHSLSSTYYGICKVRGNRKEHSLKTADRKVAERRLKDWIARLKQTNSEVEKLTLAELLRKFVLASEGKSEKTRATNASIISCFKDTWRFGLDIQVSEVKPSQLSEWLASHEGRLKNTSYNRYAGFLKQLFQIALNDGIIATSPFDVVKTKWKKPQKPLRRVPTLAQFRNIVADIRSQKFSPHAEDAADFVEFLGLAGLGQAEASSLLWKDVDWNQCKLSIQRHKTSAYFGVPIYSDLRPFLEKLLANLPEPPHPHDRVLKISDAKKALRGACRRLGYHNFSQRNIRQVLIRRLWQAKIDKKLIAKWQGHQDGGKLIMDTYTEVFGDDDLRYEAQELRKLDVSSD